MNIKTLFIFVLLIFTVHSEGEKEKVQEKKTEIQSKQDEFYSTSNNNNYVMPRMNKEPEYEIQRRTVIPLDQPVIHRVEQVHISAPACPCAMQVRCKPCGMISEPIGDSFPILTPLECPCAPRPNCPVCPPLSLLHEIASKKVYL